MASLRQPFSIVLFHEKRTPKSLTITRLNITVLPHGHNTPAAYFNEVKSCGQNIIVFRYHTAETKQRS
ncbi:hypothetical protein FOXB_15529 [Fusarium oxysporum f. sp. conglutinans Fo5176]|uniref:Uncharacterized protein n=1 Tax=Fusarium oxysporum (strain Fo5176) TaxID=660025 RepID=F9GA47_FUSOF|nr:hypothetical protein FOXB_15529 [Fusarium oxysporum f. sp. conglutinans Fo5176]